MTQPISRYIEPELEWLIVAALRAIGTNPLLTREQRRLSWEYADALENDTYLLETTTPPDEVTP